MKKKTRAGDYTPSLQTRTPTIEEHQVLKKTPKKLKKMKNTTTN